MIMMAITLKEFFIWQKVYAQDRPKVQSVSEIQAAWTTYSANPQATFGQTTAVSEIKTAWTTYSTIPTADISNMAFDFCKQQWKPWDSSKKECFKDCSNWYVEKDWVKQNECLVNGTDNLGINCNSTQLINGTCSRNINKTLGIRGSDTTPSPTILLQDIMLSATSFVGTVIMIALVVMGIKYVKWWYDESSTGDLKGNIKKLLIWLLLVIGSYNIIRLIQYVARGY